MRANVYVDGFNLYYGIKRWPQYKWLDLECMVRRVFPNDEINLIRYFTAHVSGRRDRFAPARQQAYLRALAANPMIRIHKGFFRAHQVSMRLANPTPDGNAWATVWRTEEKGSDVNLATYLLLDAVKDRCQMAVVVSNDSDLREPIRQVRQTPFNIVVWAVNPFQWPKTKMGSDHHIDLKVADIRDCQLPDTVITPNGGAVTRPTEWH